MLDPPTVDDLIGVVQELSLARDLPAVQDIVRHSARRLVGADGATFVLREGSLCFYADEDAIEPLWKGKRFPMDTCVSGWAMLHRRPAIIPDIYADDRIPQDAYRPTFVHSLVMVPIRTLDPIGAIGAYWAGRHQASPGEVRALQALADTTAVTLESVRLWEELECRVAARTAELQEVNRRLVAEIHQREEAEAHVRLLSITDELTGLHNRRGFLLLAEAAMRSAPRDSSGLLVFADLDGLKPVNDSLGHERGDEMLRAVGDVLRSCFREGDVAARIGGDEFAVIVPNATDDAARVRERIALEVERRNSLGGLPAWLRLSVGVVPFDPAAESLDKLLAMADSAMYEHKRSKRNPASSAAA